VGKEEVKEDKRVMRTVYLCMRAFGTEFVWAVQYTLRWKQSWKRHSMFIQEILESRYAMELAVFIRIKRIMLRHITQYTVPLHS